MQRDGGVEWGVWGVRGWKERGRRETVVNIVQKMIYAGC